METDEQVAELKKEKAEVESQLQVALGRIVELEEESTQREAALRQRIVELEEELKRQKESFQEKLEAERESIQGQLGEIQGQIEELKGRGAKNSHNSHKPPSSAKPTVEENRVGARAEDKMGMQERRES